MSPTLAAIAPLFVSSLFGGAMVLVWRRRPACRHALTWSAALMAMALGWLIVLIGLLAGPPPGLALAAPRLCWLAAALLIVHGLRQRGRRRSRHDVLAAIWAVIAFATTWLPGIAPADGLPPLLLILMAVGTGVAAVAVGPRAVLSTAPRQMRLDWFAMLLLIAVASVCMAGAVIDLLGAEPAFDRGDVAIGAAIGIVALGLALLVVLNADLATALERLARIDPLTRIWNRRGFDEAAQHILATQAERFGPIAAVAIADIDAFKSINDRFGHAAGDAVLVRFAEMLKLAEQPGDLLARLGGEEFALLAVRCDGPSLLGRVERVRAAMAASGPSLEAPLPITASFGVAELDAGRGALRDALERADKALYRAKAEGRDRSILSGGRDAATPAD